MESALLSDGSMIKLGRIPPKSIRQLKGVTIIEYADGRVKHIPSLEAYYSSIQAEKALPDKVDWYEKGMDSIKRMYANDRYGCCVVSGKYHTQGVVSANELGKTALGTDNEVISAYRRICGPGDNGCIITDVLDYWRDKGLLFDSGIEKIDGYVSIDHTNKRLVQTALYLFGSITLGIWLPKQWTCTNCIWNANASGNVGGHDVAAVGYDDKGVICSTWGGLVTITWDAFLQRRWVEEAYVPLVQDWYAGDNIAPCGIDASTLKRDLQIIEGGDIPPIDVDPPPSPPIPPTPPLPPIPPGPSPGPTIFSVAIPPIPISLLNGMVKGTTEAVVATGGFNSSSQYPFYQTVKQQAIPPWVWPIILSLGRNLFRTLCNRLDSLPEGILKDALRIACQFAQEGKDRGKIGDCGCKDKIEVPSEILRLFGDYLSKSN